jgi:hypothetical protein
MVPNPPERARDRHALIAAAIMTVLDRGFEDGYSGVLNRGNGSGSSAR